MPFEETHMRTRELQEPWSNWWHPIWSWFLNSEPVWTCQVSSKLEGPLLGDSLTDGFREGFSPLSSSLKVKHTWGLNDALWLSLLLLRVGLQAQYVARKGCLIKWRESFLALYSFFAAKENPLWGSNCGRVSPGTPNPAHLGSLRGHKW